MTIYNQGLNSPFANWIAEKVRYTLDISIEEMLDIGLFDITAHDNYYEVHPLFNYDTVTSSNPNDHTENKNTVILQKNNTTTLSFKSNTEIMEYKETIMEQIIDNIKYTIHYTYDPITNEPAPYKPTSNGNTTDENGYYLDSEVIT